MKKKMTYSASETEALGYDLGNQLKGMHAVILLDGDLAAGKTTFTKGIGKALGIKKEINSPTFTIMKQYEGSQVLKHFDFYRLQGVGNDFDFEEYIDNEGIVVIEWPHQARDLWPLEYIYIHIEKESENTRTFTIECQGIQYERVKL